MSIVVISIGEAKMQFGKAEMLIGCKGTLIDLTRVGIHLEVLSIGKICVVQKNYKRDLVFSFSLIYIYIYIYIADEKLSDFKVKKKIQSI